MHPKLLSIINLSAYYNILGSNTATGIYNFNVSDVISVPNLKLAYLIT